MPRHDRDPAPRRTLLLLLTVFGCVGATVVLMLALLRPASEAAQGAQPAPAPVPLQSAPQPDLAVWRARKQAELQSVGPVPCEPGWIRIPLERAMDLLSTQGLRATGDIGPQQADAP